MIFFGWVKPCTSMTLGSVSMRGMVFFGGVVVIFGSHKSRHCFVFLFGIQVVTKPF